MSRSYEPARRPMSLDDRWAKVIEWFMGPFAEDIRELRVDTERAARADLNVRVDAVLESAKAAVDAWERVRARMPMSELAMMREPRDELMALSRAVAELRKVKP